jgi:exopolyphosphatase / guanosine-5'-triphosphate,3'-diphosphate pyrophosphatase
MPDPGPLQALFGPGDAARLARCAVLLRLAEDLERSRDQLVRGTRFTRIRAPGGAPAADASANGDGGGIELRLIADGEPAVPRWAASRESELFARAFHRELRVAV